MRSWPLRISVWPASVITDAQRRQWTTASHGASVLTTDMRDANRARPATMPTPNPASRTADGTEPRLSAAVERTMPRGDVRAIRRCALSSGGADAMPKPTERVAAVDIPVVTTMVSGYGEAVDVLVGRGRWAAASRALRAELAAHERRKHRLDAARTSIALGRLHLAMGEVGPAARCFDRAGELASMSEPRPGLIRMRRPSESAVRRLRHPALRRRRASDWRSAAMVGHGRVGRCGSRTKRTLAAKRARGDRTGSRSASGVRDRVVARALPLLAGPRSRNRSSTRHRRSALSHRADGRSITTDALRAP